MLTNSCNRSSFRLSDWFSNKSSNAACVNRWNTDDAERRHSGVKFNTRCFGLRYSPIQDGLQIVASPTVDTPTSRNNRLFGRMNEPRKKGNQ